jgi:SpoVK/Ycf46/Vps4 family AAA+-type ATPase
MDDLQGRRLLAELLLQLSSLTLEDRVAVLAATNRVDDVDVALLRRFHARVGVGLPDACDRLALISKYLDGLDHTLTPLDKQAVAARTESWSGSDVSSLVR